MSNPKNNRLWIETLDILNSNNNIDVILSDYKMPFYNGKQVLDNIKNKNKYINSCIIISGEIKDVTILKDNPLVHSIIFKTLTLYEINKKINEIINYKETLKREKSIKNKILNELLYLGYDISHKGT